MAEYLILIFEDENAYATATPDVFQQVMDAHNRFAGQVGEKGGKIVEGRRPAADQHRHHHPQRRGDRRPVRGDQGSPRRLLPDRGPRPGPRAGDRQAEPRPGSAASRSGRSWCSPRGDPFHPGRPSADLGPGTGSGAGRDRPAAAAAVADAHRREWAFVLAATVRVAGDLDLAEECVQDAYVSALEAWSAAGRAAQPRGLADHHRAAPGPRPAAPRHHAAPQAPAAGGAGRARGARRGAP